MRRTLTVAGSVLALAATLLLPAAGSAQTREAFLKSAPRILEVFAEVVARPSESTARVVCEGKEVALATIVEADGLLLTKFSELVGTEPVVRLKDGKELKGTILGAHKLYDLALIRVEAKELKPVEWRTEGPAPGDWLVTPGPAEKPLYVGVVSVAARKTSRFDFPVLAIPPAGSGFLGVQLDDFTTPGKVVITTADKDTPAEKAGVKAKDVLLAIDGKPIKETTGVQAIVSAKKPGEMVTLKVQRGDEEKELVVTLGKRPVSGPNRGDFQNNLGSELSKLKTGFPTVLQHDTVVKPADCGGPLVDIDGKVVGINIARAGRVETYAVPVDAILKVLPELKEGKHPLPK